MSEPKPGSKISWKSWLVLLAVLGVIAAVAITKGAGGTGEIELTATMRSEGVDRRVQGQTARMLSADGGKSWTCKPGTMPNKNLPASCRD